MRRERPTWVVLFMLQYAVNTMMSLGFDSLLKIHLSWTAYHPAYRL